MNSKQIAFLIALIFIIGCSEPVKPVTPAGSDFIRLVEDDGKGAKLEVAIGFYVNPEGVHVDLIGVVHFADEAYYKMLQKFFKAYDVVLYEMIAPKNSAAIDPGNSFLSHFQHNMGKAMGMVSQMDTINYRCDNFVRADLTPNEVIEKFFEKNRGFWSAFKNSLSMQLTMQQCGVGKHMTGDAMIEAYRSKDKASKLKLIMAKELEASEKAFIKLEEDGPTTIIGDRNKAAIDVLIEEKEKHKKLAIFYGAAHMADMEARLQRDLGFEKTGHYWFTAWDIKPVKEEDSSGDE